MAQFRGGWLLLRIAKSIVVSLFLVVFIAIISSAHAQQGTGTGPTIRLAPGDRLTVTVFGQADLSGVFQVDGDGNLELPLAGTIAVGQLSVRECEKQVEARLANGFIQTPVVSVRLTELRPIYILGDVRAPGSFPFRYGSTALSAIAQAGGYAGAELPVTVAAVDFLSADERVLTLEQARRTLLVRAARLEAQRDGRTTFDPPALDATAEADDQGAAAVAATIASEKEVLKAQTTALREALELHRGQKPRLESSAAAIEKQIVADKRQSELVQSQLSDQAKLQTMGLGRRTTEVSLQREQAALDSSISRYRSELARLTVTIGEVDIRIQEAQSAYDQRVLAELQEVRRRLQETDAALPSAREVRALRLQQAGSARAFDLLAGSRRIVVTRTINSQVKTMDISESTPLEPGDVIDVKRVRMPEGYKGATLSRPVARMLE